MIVCHCNVITKAVIAEAIEELVADDPYRLITPGLVYRQLGKRGKCCGCFPQVVALIVDRLEQFQTSNPGYTVQRTSIAPGLQADLARPGAFEGIALAPVRQRDL
ncbi:MAG: (2Fe-2S)-binding protein [Devosiaceae bacterium]|nr:(2Fe-2S)-binding protein [Devosiaceae bacterium MH13]